MKKRREDKYRANGGGGGGVEVISVNRKKGRNGGDVKERADEGITVLKMLLMVVGKDSSIKGKIRREKREMERIHGWRGEG